MSGPARSFRRRNGAIRGWGRSLPTDFELECWKLTRQANREKRETRAKTLISYPAIKRVNKTARDERFNGCEFRKEVCLCRVS